MDEYGKSLIESFCFSENRDRWVQDGSGMSLFLVSWARKMIDKQVMISSDHPIRWIKHVPIKINVFVQRLLLDKLPTCSNLSRRGLDVRDLSCVICSHSVENIFHIVRGCSVAKEVWMLIQRWRDIDFPHWMTIRDVFNWVDGLILNMGCKMALITVVITNIWTFWKFRNDMIFGHEKPKKSMIFFILLYLVHWFSCRSKMRSLSWIGFVCNPIRTVNSL